MTVRILNSWFAMLALLLLTSSTAFGQRPSTQTLPLPPPKSPLLIVDNERIKIQGRIELTVGGIAYRGSFFNLAAIKVPEYNSHRRWMEGGFEPGVDITFRPWKGLEVYGGLSLGFTGTLGTDAFEARNVGSISMENGFIGIRTRNPGTSWNLDLSVGQQDYVVGTGLLLSLGAENGSERGGANLLPRSAWSNASVARFTYKGLRLDGFYLDPNSLDSVDTEDRLTGAAVEYRWSEESRVGMSYIKVLESTLAYPLPSLPLFIDDGRDGDGVIDSFAEIGLSNAWLRGEFVLERNARIDMKAYALYGAIGYRFPKARMEPAISVEYAVFSADDPNTSQYERFDPLFYGEGSVDWFFGANSSFAFFNSSVNQLRASLDLTGSEKDSFTFQYVHSRANKLNSPIQFSALHRVEIVDGQPTITTGVKDSHLADEIYGEWTHALTRTSSISFWGSAAFPGRGIKILPGARPENWLGIGTTFVFTF